MSLLSLVLKQTCDIPSGTSTRTVACRAERAERIGGGGYYYQDWVVYLEDYVAYGATVTITGETARTVYDSREYRSLGGTAKLYKLVLGHVP